MARFRILQVIDQLNVGGAERVLVDLSNLLHEWGAHIDVLTLVRAGPLSGALRPQIGLKVVGRSWRFSLLSLYRTHLICSNYPIVHVHLRYNYRYISLAKLIFRGKYSLLFHDHYGDIEKDKAVPFALGFFLRRNKWFAGVSRTLVQWALVSVGIQDRYAHHLPNIVLKQRVVGRLSNSGSSLRILLVSNFRLSKNHSFAIKMLTELKSRRDFRADFIGQVIDASYFHDVLERIKSNDLTESVEIITDCSDVQPLLATYDIAIHTADKESGPLVLIEYVAQNLRFVAYQTGEVSDQIGSILPELFVDNFDVDQWLARLDEVLEMSTGDLKGRMDACFSKFYAPENYVEKCIDIYDDMTKLK